MKASPAVAKAIAARMMLAENCILDNSEEKTYRRNGIGLSLMNVEKVFEKTVECW